MLTTLAISNYRTLLKLVLPLGPLNVITGPNGSGKSNLYRALRLLAETAQGGVIHALAREGGLESVFWAGPEKLSRRMRKREVEIQGGPRSKPVRLSLGFADEDLGYCIGLGLPASGNTAFSLDPEIKWECIWAGSSYRPASSLVERRGPLVKTRSGRNWQVIARHVNPFDSMFGEVGDPERSPEVLLLRERIRAWRFYDHFRTDAEAPARIPQLGTRTPVLHHDGRDLAAALQTIYEIGDHEALNEAIEFAFPGGKLQINVQSDRRFVIEFWQHGLLRPLSGAELSDGTLRYLLWVAALLTPRPPALMILNEPETSLHPDLLPALGRLIGRAAENSQIWVVSHANRLIAELNKHPQCCVVELEKELGQTHVQGLDELDEPAWQWPGK